MSQQPLTARICQIVAALIVAGLLGSCAEHGPLDKLDDYLRRLARTLNTELIAAAPVRIPKPPKVSALRLSLPSATLDALDFLALSGCAVQITIGKRNSSLGKFASDSQRLLLELEYLQLAPECINTMRQQGKTQLAQTLEQAHRLKREQLPAFIFNATLANIEYRQLWRKPPALADYPAQTSSLVLSSLQAINANARRWIGGDYRTDNRGFEIHLSEVAKGDGGTLWLALAAQDSRLTAANRMLETRMQRSPLCQPGITPAAAQILETVIHKYFIGEVQPWSAALNRRHHELLPPILALETLLDSALPGAYREWRASRDSELLHLSRSPRHHVERLQGILAACTD